MFIRLGYNEMEIIKQKKLAGFLFVCFKQF